MFICHEGNDNYIVPACGENIKSELMTHYPYHLTELNVIYTNLTNQTHEILTKHVK